jgi:two-component system, response regulator
MSSQRSEVEILLVEDDPADAELTMRALRKHKLANNIVHVTDGEQALDFIFCEGAYSGRSMTHTPRVMVLDLKLPKVTGREVLRAMKADARAKLIPVVVLTSSTEERDIVESYRLGVNSYIVKPVDFDKFAEAVKDFGMYWLLLNVPPEH